MTDGDSRSAVFLELIQAARDAQLGELRERAAAEARTLGREARREARERVRAAVVECRARSLRALAQAQAELDTLRRHDAQRAHRIALAEGERRLEDVLCQRWRDAASRRAWIDGLIADAILRLPAGPWRLAYPAALPAAELAEVSKQIEGHAGSPPELEPDAGIVAGLRVAARSAVLDGTIRGLLARRGEVEGRLLAEVDAILAEAQ